MADFGFKEQEKFIYNCLFTFAILVVAKTAIQPLLSGDWLLLLNFELITIAHVSTKVMKFCLISTHTRKWETTDSTFLSVFMLVVLEQTCTIF